MSLLLKETAFQMADTLGLLRGQLRDGTVIVGTNAVSVVP
jgi:hypothetical protein